MDWDEIGDLERDLAKLIVGVDILAGGDISKRSGAYHYIADTWTSGLPLPEIHGQSQGIPRDDRNQFIESLVKIGDLEELPDGLKKQALQIADPIRRTFLKNQIDALEIIFKTILSDARGQSVPSFEERYTLGSKEPSVRLIDPAEHIERLTMDLEGAGYVKRRDETLAQCFSRWQDDKGSIQGSNDLQGRAKVLSQEFLERVKQEIFPIIDGLHGIDFNNVSFDGQAFELLSDVDFTGSSAYIGGDVNGVPSLKGLFEYNLAHPVNYFGMLHLISHETMPGHYFASAVSDLLWRSGRLGLEMTMSTMCTPSVVFHEGWAENAFALLYGSFDEGVEKFENAKDLRVQIAKCDLENVGKNNAPILYQFEGRDIEVVRSHLRDDCSLPEPIVSKLSGGWAINPILGPMYGPAYFHGKKIVSEQILKHGREKVIVSGLGFNGPVDIETFQMLLN